jgi:hypothetical protein
VALIAVMTPDEVAEAKRMARIWMLQHRRQQTFADGTGTPKLL